MNPEQKKSSGMLAEFANPAALLSAAQKLRDAGYKKFDCHSPFPIHGMDAAMGLKRSPLGWIVGMVALIGFSSGMLLEWWTSAVDYKLTISGKPFFSYQAFGTVAFAIMIFSSAFAALLGFLGLTKLPKFYHHLFGSEQFTKFSDDAFFVSIDSADDKYDSVQTRILLEGIGGKNVEDVSEE